MAKQHIDTFIPLVATWVGAGISYLDRGFVTFMMGVSVSVLAIVHYTLEIRKDLRSEISIRRRFRRKSRNNHTKV